MPKFYFYNHQNKGIQFIDALKNAGFEFTAKAGNADMVFSDTDVQGRNIALLDFHRRGKPVFIYPHAARPNLFNDFYGYSAFPHTAMQFVSSPGHIDIMRIVGIECPLEVIGWGLCPLLEFKPRYEARKVLFAPIHPNSDGSITQIQKNINVETYKKLLSLVDRDEIVLTVRYIHKLEQNGLWDHIGVTFIEGKTDLSFQQIDSADLVVSHQTFAYLAVARGVPTVMMGEWYHPMLCEHNGKDVKTALSFEKYKHLLMYPLDILAESDTKALFARAISTDIEISEWRDRMIGKAFDPERFIEIVKRYV